MTLLLVLACSDYDIVPDPADPADPQDDLPELLPPYAVAGPGGAVKRWELATPSGEGSFDPDDEDAELLYTWELVDQPAEATVVLTDELSVQPSLMAGSVGLYTLALTVTDLDDLESPNPALSVVEVLPWEDLVVELGWDRPELDLDLHLVQQDGAYYGEGDCYFGNPAPDWGQPGLGADDPSLDQDDETGVEGERIELPWPEERSYEVYVHFYNRRGASAGSTKPSLLVHGESQQIGALTGPALTEGEVWHAGTVRWPELSFEVVDSVTTHEALGGPAYND